MTDFTLVFRSRVRAAALAFALAAAACGAAAQSGADARARVGDYIVAVVNQELVTAGELDARIAAVRANAERSGATLPPQQQLRRQVLDALINERVQVSHARDSGTRVDENDVDRAVASIAAQNQLSLTQLRAQLRREGIDYGMFRNNVRDQIMVERVREREVQQRIRITDAEIDAVIEQERAQTRGTTEYNIAQVLVTVPEDADEATVAQRRARAEAALARLKAALARLKAGEAFDAVAREISEDGNRAQGGAIGLRPADRLPDVFVAHVRRLAPGEVAPTLLRTGAGFHALKLLEKREGNAFTVPQTRARHILLRPSAQLPADAAARRLADFKRQVLAGTATFEQLARENSEDGSAVQGGDLGWTTAGSFVPEFEQAMNALPIGGISDPVESRFGLHLIQVVERRQVSLDAREQRELARNMLRERKFDEAYADWLRELRARAYVELREPPP
jgi:peptidyl-prolyl cis-trans isomerase SurA